MFDKRFEMRYSFFLLYTGKHMIISTGIRTDIVNHYSDWLFERFREGFVLTRNPLFPNKVTRYRLSPDAVDAVVFCSKNYQPVLNRISSITAKYRTFFHYTITAYGKDIEPNMPSQKARIATLIELSSLVGRERLMWRFQPVFFTEEYPPERVLDTFDMLAEQIAPHVCGCIFGYVEAFFNLRTRMPELIPLDSETKRAFAGRIAALAKKHALPMQTCGIHNTYEEYGIASRGCYTLDMIGTANNCVFRNVKHTGNSRGCLCITCRDIGWYDSCPNLCLYCNANHSVAEVKENVRRHDPHSPLLIGLPREDDEISEGIQTSFLRDERQISLFDL